MSIFSLWMIFNPYSILETYKIDVTNSTNSTYTSTDKLLVSGTVQLLGIWYAVGAGALTITLRNGTDDQKSMLCFITGLWFVVAILCQFLSVPHFSEIGVPASGAYFNAGLGFLIGLLCFLGADCPPKISMAPVRKPLYWGYIARIVVLVVFMLLMFCIPDKLMESYGLEVSASASTVLVGFMKFSMAPWFLYVALICLAQLLVMGPCATYGYNRWLATCDFALMVVSAIWAGVWQSLNENGKYDKLIKGQYFNMVMYFVLFLIFYASVALLDPAVVKDNIEKEIMKEEDMDYLESDDDAEEES